MEARRRTEFDARGLRSRRAPGGERSPLHLPFYAGAMHYWRVPKTSWAACLRAMHELGLTLVETYVPWRVHEPARGRFDLRELPEFVAMARAEGLHVVLRPGPHVNAELTSFGMPDWVLAEPACQARTSRGTPAWMPTPPRAWPIPSYASRAFHAHVRAWYAAVAEVVAPYLAPTARSPRSASTTRRRWSSATACSTSTTTPTRSPGGATRAGSTAIRRAMQATRRAPRCGCDSRTTTSRARSARSRPCSMTSASAGSGASTTSRPAITALYDLRKIQTAIGGPVGIDAYTPRAQFPSSAAARSRAPVTRCRCRSRSRSASDSSRGFLRSIHLAPPTIRRASAITC